MGHSQDGNQSRMLTETSTGFQPPPQLEVSERIKLWLLKFVFLGTHSEVILFACEFLLLKT